MSNSKKEIFQMHHMTDYEVMVFVIANVKAGEDPEKVTDDAIFVDKCLTLMAQKSLLTKKRGLTKELKALLDAEIGIRHNLNIKG